VLPGDDADTLSARVIVQEHRLYPAALALIAGGGAVLEGGRVRFTAQARDAGAAILSL
jgi:phosphoribosylglycinamide formyltransferase-1